MRAVSVILSGDNHQDQQTFRQVVNNMRQKWRLDPLEVECKEGLRGGCYAFTFVMWSRQEHTAETLDKFRSFLSCILSEWIVTEYERNYIVSALQYGFDDDTASEWDEILPWVAQALDQMQGRWIRQAYVFDRIYQFLEDNRWLSLDGFLRFRLKEYRKLLQVAVEKGIDQYLREKEYLEFIALLRYFVSVQESKHDLIHVISDQHPPFLLIDHAGNQIRLDQLDSVLATLPHACREEDYLVSALITLAPKQIVFHQSERKPELFRTLSLIFANRLMCCPDCSHNKATWTDLLDLHKPTHYNT